MTIRRLLEEFVNNPLLREVVPQIIQADGDFLGYDMGDAGGLATKVFDLMEIAQDRRFSVRMLTVLEETSQQHRRSVIFDENSGHPIIPISGALTMQGMIEEFLKPEYFTQENRWKPDGVNPVPSKKTNYLSVANIASVPALLMFNITPPVEALQVTPLRDIEDEIFVPVHDYEGRILGRMRMQLYAIGCNAPNAHFLAYVKEPNGSWTEHNDSIITPLLTKNQIFGETRLHASMYGFQFSYRTVEFQPART